MATTKFQHHQWPSLSIANSELHQETAHVMTTVHDAEMTTHQLSDNIWLNVVKDDYCGEEEMLAASQHLQLFASSNNSAREPGLLQPAVTGQDGVNANATFGNPITALRNDTALQNEKIAGNGDTLAKAPGLAASQQPTVIEKPIDDAHHMYTYTLEVTDSTIQVDIRLDFGDSQNVEVVDDENVLREGDGRYIVVGTVMPMTSQLICKVKAYDVLWRIDCQVTMIKRSAPLAIQEANMLEVQMQMETLIGAAKKKWGTKALSLMTIEELQEMVKDAANENGKLLDNLPAIMEEDVTEGTGTLSLHERKRSMPLPQAMAVGASRKRFSECKMPGQVINSEEQALDKNKQMSQAQSARYTTVALKSFLDIEFPPCDESINKTIIKSILAPQNQTSQETITGFDRIIHWRRPVDYMNNPTSSSAPEFPPNTADEDKIIPTVFPENETSLLADVKEISKGHIHHDWLICSLISLIEKNEQLVKRLFVTKEYSPEGIYRLTLYVQGRWQTITIDDYFPCLPRGQPFFASIVGSRCIWLNLIEKAFAKVFGGYKYLEGGSSQEALRMLTGSPLTSFCFGDDSVQELIETGAFRLLIADFLSKRSYVVVASTQPGGPFVKDKSPLSQTAQQYTTQTQEYGSQSIRSSQGGGAGGRDDLAPCGCSFAITGMREQNGQLFLRCVDKWDVLSNKGRHGPQSAHWTPFMQHEFDFDPVQAELTTGEFWVTMNELTELFHSLDVCRITSWDTLSIKGQFIRRTKKDKTSGVQDDQNLNDNILRQFSYASKWFYGLEVATKSHCIFGVHQENPRCNSALAQFSPIDVGIAILKKEVDGTVLKEMKDFQVSQHLECEAILYPGTYIVVPRTTGCLFERMDYREAFPFLDELVTQDSTGANRLTARMEAVCEQIFNRFDTLDKRSLDFDEFKAFLIESKFGLIEDMDSLDDYKTIILKYFNSDLIRADGLTLTGFKHFMLRMIENSYRETVTTLKNLGFNGNLVNQRNKSFTLSVHSKPLEGSSRVKVLVRESDMTNIDTTATQLILEKYGEPILRKSSYSILVQQSPLNQSWSYGIVNHLSTGELIEGKLSFEGSKNLHISASANMDDKSVTKVIKPGQIKFFVHCQAGLGSYKKEVYHEVRTLPSRF